MDEHKIAENKPLNLKNGDIEIKQELQNFDNDAENLNLLEVEISPSALSYGEVYIIENEGETPFTWWISCNICQDKFDNIENFLDHARDMHLNRQTSEILKTETENFYTENITNDVQDENIVEPQLARDKDSDDDYVVDSDYNNSSSESDLENEERYYENIPGESTRKKGLPKHCEKCNKTFKKPSALRRHLNVHVKKENKMYECKICHETFTSEQKRLYRNHRDRVHKEKIPCLLCEKSFGSKFYLDAHMKTHTGTKDFKCKECSAAFYSQTSLSGHVRKTHLTPKVPCRYCSKLFRPGSCLEIHERIHTGEKPFVCEQCGTAFQTNSLLQNHIKRHNNDRRFECDICGKKFFNHTYLRDHKVTHTDAKPYGCEICNARFNSGPALRKHKNLHSGVKKYQCKICGKSYAQSPGLYAHMKSHNIAENKS